MCAFHNPGRCRILILSSEPTPIYILLFFFSWTGPVFLILRNHQELSCHWGSVRDRVTDVLSSPVSFCSNSHRRWHTRNRLHDILSTPLHQQCVWLVAHYIRCERLRFEFMQLIDLFPIRTLYNRQENCHNQWCIWIVAMSTIPSVESLPVHYPMQDIVVL